MATNPLQRRVLRAMASATAEPAFLTAQEIAVTALGLTAKASDVIPYLIQLEKMGKVERFSLTGSSAPLWRLSETNAVASPSELKTITAPAGAESKVETKSTDTSSSGPVTSPASAAVGELMMALQGFERKHSLPTHSDLRRQCHSVIETYMERWAPPVAVRASTTTVPAGQRVVPVARLLSKPAAQSVKVTKEKQKP